MFSSSPGSLFSSLIISLLGYAAYRYGRSTRDAPVLGVGVVMMLFPYFVDSVWAMWLIVAGCAGGVYLVRRLA